MVPGTNTTESPPPPLRNKGPELGADNLTLEGVTTELAPSDFVSQNYETLVALMQEETKKRSSQSLQARLTFGPEDEVSPPCHQKERRGKDNRRPPVFGRIGKKVSGTQTANLQNLDTYENNDWRISVCDRLGSRDVHSRLGQRRSPSEIPPSSDPEDSRRKRRRRVSSSSEDSSDNEDAETGHWKSKNKYREDEDEDMSRPWRRQKVDAFTRRISNFSEDKKRRMPANVKTYDGTGDPDDHLKIFESAATIENWPQPVWCHMFNYTLVGNARNWFNKLPRRSIDGFEELRRAFRLNFNSKERSVHKTLSKASARGETARKGSPQKRLLLIPRESRMAADIKKATQTTSRGTVPETNNDQKVGSRNNSYRGQRGGRGNDKYTPLTMTPKEILATEGANFPNHLPIAHVQKSNAWGTDTIGSPVHAGRKTKQKSQPKIFRMEWQTLFPTLTADNAVVEPLTIEINAGGHDIHRIYIDGGASADILYEHYFQRLRPEEKRALHNSMDEFYGDQITIAIQWHYWKTRNLSDTRGPIHGLRDAKIPRRRRNCHHLRTSAAPPKECNTVTCDVTQRQHATKVTNLKVAIHPDYPEQEVSIGRPRTAVKGQILADFLIEKPETDAVLPQSEVKLQEPWILFTDGSSCVDGSGAGLILTNPEGMEFTYALRFEFTATNNEAEYEALIADYAIAALEWDVRNLDKQMWTPPV
ncbi:reverse transcriptase domain-containing protein [Tanacetum coccineum]